VFSELELMPSTHDNTDSVKLLVTRTAIGLFVSLVLRVRRWDSAIALKKTPCPESASELYRPSDRRLSANLVSTFADRGCHVVSVTDPYGLILGFLDRSCYFFFQAAPQLYSRGWVDPVADPLLLRKTSSAENRTRTSRSVARNYDH
jgi:hypothetical protein